MMPDSDPRLAEAAVQLQRYASNGDKAALEQCLAACLEPAWRQAYAELGCDADAQDAAQEALLQLTRSADRFESGRPLGPWLARHVTFACAHLRRSAARRRRREDAVMQEQLRAQQSVDAPADNEDLEKVRGALSHLNDKDRALISLHYFAGLSQAETAQELGISENAASVRMHRARGKLKRILEQQGVSSGIALLPVLAQSVPAAPAHLLPQLVQLCSAASLPATTITLTITEKLIMMIQTHPIMSAVVACVLSIAGISSPLLFAADQMPQQNTPPVVAEAGPRWNPAAEKLLKFHDPDALIQFAMDGPAVREMLLETKPFSYLKTEAGQELLANWEREFERYQRWDEGSSELPLMVDLWRYNSGFFLQTDNPPYRPSFAFALNDHKQRLMNSLLGSSEKTGEQRGGFEMYQNNAAVDGTTFVKGVTVFPDSVTVASDLQRYPAWFRLHPKKLLASFRENSDLLYNLEDYLGPGWKQRDIEVAMHLKQDEDILELHGLLKGVEANALLLGAIIVYEEFTGYQDIPVSPIKMQKPKQLPAAAENALLSLRFGCDYQQHDVITAALIRVIESEVKLPALAAAWNGECLLSVEQGIPFPKPDLVLGLTGDLSELRIQLSQVLSGLGAQKADVTQGYNDVWTLMSPIGMLQIALGQNRLVVSANSKLTELAKSASAEHAFELTIDVPTLARRYGPMLWSMIPLKQTPLSGFQIFEMRRFEFDVRSAIVEMEHDGPDNGKTFSQYVGEDSAKWLGSDLPIEEYISVWKNKSDGHASLHILFRSQEGWHFFDDPVYRNSPANENLKLVKHQLREFTHVAGSKLEDLKLHPRGAIPVIELGEHIPKLPDLINALPVYRLIWDRDPNGTQHFVESGLTLSALIYAPVSLALMNLNPEQEVKVARQFKQKVDIFEAHEKRIAALKKISVSMRMNRWDRPSDILKYAPEDTLWALGLGDKPTADQIDQLGRWVGNGECYMTLTSDINRETKSETQSIGPVKWAFKFTDDSWALLGKSKSFGITMDEPPFKGKAVKPLKKKVPAVESPADLDF